MDCENCRGLTVVGLHDTGPRVWARGGGGGGEVRGRSHSCCCLEVNAQTLGHGGGKNASAKDRQTDKDLQGVFCLEVNLTEHTGTVHD